MLADLGAQVKGVATLAGSWGQRRAGRADVRAGGEEVAMRSFIAVLVRRLVRMAVTAAVLAALGAAVRAAIGWVSGEPGTPGMRTGSFDTFPPVPPAPVAGNGAS
jgi:hypothetical protein